MGQYAVTLAPMSIQDCKFKTSTTWSLLFSPVFVLNDVVGQAAVTLAPMSIQECRFKTSTTWSLLFLFFLFL